jgi:UDP-N-acetylmuramate: L-alanyl-gamma-D-glutamyl-meso-diaminopimelate ligase
VIFFREIASLHLHILGISGTFMSALALLARDLGHVVTGSDAHCYPPISTLLEAQGIEWSEGYQDSKMALAADCVIVGNAITRGLPVIEAVLDAGKPYISGPQWLAENVLAKRRVIAVAGTHGKTTTTSMITWILHKAGLNPGFLIGGVSANLHTSASLGTGEWFVIEADEYDSAFFDKRPKFIHYRPTVALLNNLEFDHADIYPDLKAIQQQFHYLLKTVPATGLVIAPQEDKALQTVLSHGLYSRCEQWAVAKDAPWSAKLLDESGKAFTVHQAGREVARVEWSLIGSFNVANGLAAILACQEAGIDPKLAAEALASFVPVKRRLEVVSDKQGVTIYDDFAHHPTAIRATLEALKGSKRHARLFVVMEFASYTMRSGVHTEAIPNALALAQGVYILDPGNASIVEGLSSSYPASFYKTTQEIIQALKTEVRTGDAVVIMSNRGFNGIHQQLAQVLGEGESNGVR